jgi:hypothetical protein
MKLSFSIENDAIAGLLVSEALRLRCDPRQLGAALLSVVLDSSLVDSVLDGSDPKIFARSRKARLPIEDRIDAVMLHVVTVIHHNPEGRAVLGVRDIARAVGAKSGVVGRVLKLLIDNGRLNAQRGGHKEKTVYSLPSREAGH